MLKYTPENLIEMYLNGILPPDARAEFVRLMRQDPRFAEEVAQALERSEAEFGSVGTREGREDRMMADADDFGRPPRPRSVLKRTAPWIGILLVATGLGWAFNAVLPLLSTFLYPAFHLAETQSNGSSSSAAQGMNGKNGKLIPAMIGKPKLGQAQKGNGMEPTTTVVPTATVVGTAEPTPDTRPKPVEVVTDKTEKVVITVQDSTGQVVRTLYKGTWLAGKHFIPWDGTNDLFFKVPPGDYTILVQGDNTNSSNVVTIP